MRSGDLVVVAEHNRRPQDINSIGLLYRATCGQLMIMWNDEPDPEELELYDDDDLEVVSEGCDA